MSGLGAVVNGLSFVHTLCILLSVGFAAFALVLWAMESGRKGSPDNVRRRLADGWWVLAKTPLPVIPQRVNGWLVGRLSGFIRFGFEEATKHSFRQHGVFFAVHSAAGPGAGKYADRRLTLPGQVLPFTFGGFRVFEFYRLNQIDEILQFYHLGFPGYFLISRYSGLCAPRLYGNVHSQCFYPRGSKKPLGGGVLVFGDLWYRHGV